MDFIERFRDPESITDYHLVAFIIQLVVIAGVVLGFYKFIMVTDAGRYELDTEDTFISSVIKKGCLKASSAVILSFGSYFNNLLIKSFAFSESDKYS